MTKMTVGFIGTGVMGRSMAKHLLEAGYKVVVYNRSREKSESLLALGAIWADSVSLLAAECQAVITMVGYPRDVEQVYFSPDGLIESIKPGSYLIDMTTSSPKLAARIYAAAREKGVFALDAPVSGGDVGAREARLSIMAGGDETAFQDMLPLFKVLGKNVVLQGAAGSGQHTKMCNQIVIAANMMGVCEAMAYAGKAGLDPAVVLNSIESGAAGSWSLSNLAPRMLAGDFAPGFYVKHFIKDMKIAVEAAEEMGLDAPALKLALALYERLAAAGEADSGTQALYKLYQA